VKKYHVWIWNPQWGPKPVFVTDRTFWKSFDTRAEATKERDDCAEAGVHAIVTVSVAAS
jgi:hypothetical protein